MKSGYNAIIAVREKLKDAGIVLILSVRVVASKIIALIAKVAYMGWQLYFKWTYLI